MTTIALFPNLAFGQLELLGSDGSHQADIPSWLIDKPRILNALLILAEQGGTDSLGRAPDWHDVHVDVDAGTTEYILGGEA